MLLCKDAIADVLEALSPADFYRPAHQRVYDAILDLYARGEPADTVTVAAELDQRGLLGRIGGAPYLHTLIATVPTAANAGYYAQIVAEKAILRRLVEAGTRIVQFGYGGDGEMAAARSTRSSTGPRPRSTTSPNGAPPRTTSRWKTCCSRRWTRSTRSPSSGGQSHAACPPASPNSTTSPTACIPGR